MGEISTPRHPAESSLVSRGGLIDRKREFRLPKSTDETLEELVTPYKHSTGVALTCSHVLRAVMTSISDAMPSLRREAETVGPLKRPSNAKGYEDQCDEFEGEIAEAFRRGMRG